MQVRVVQPRTLTYKCGFFVWQNYPLFTALYLQGTNSSHSCEQERIISSLCCCFVGVRQGILLSVYLYTYTCKHKVQCVHVYVDGFPSFFAEFPRTMFEFLNMKYFLVLYETPMKLRDWFVDKNAVQHYRLHTVVACLHWRISLSLLKNFIIAWSVCHVLKSVVKCLSGE